MSTKKEKALVAGLVTGGTATGALTGSEAAITRRKRLKKIKETVVEKNDPFGINKSAPKIPGMGDKARRAAYGAKQSFKARTGERKVNAEKATRVGGLGGNPSGEKFGARAPREKRPKAGPMSYDQKNATANVAVLGAAAGGFGGYYGNRGAAKRRQKSLAEYNKQGRQIAANRAEIKSLKANQVSKRETRYNISDVGQKVRNPKAPHRWPHAPKGAAIIGGSTAVGVAYGAGKRSMEAGYAQRAVNSRKGALKRQEKKIAELSKGVDMTTSAFGVDHGEISKADRKARYGNHKAPSVERRVVAGLAGPFHSAVAGKQGKKLRATGTTVGNSIGGAVVGGTLGGLTKKPTVAQTGAQLGQIAGVQRAVNVNTRKGRYKKES